METSARGSADKKTWIRRVFRVYFFSVVCVVWGICVSIFIVVKVWVLCWWR